MSVFELLNNVDVGEHIEKKNGLSYLSWAWAWREVKKRYPEATYTIYENANGWNYHTDGKTCWVKTGVTIEGLEHVEYLPVMDFRNNSIPFDKVTSFDVNKAIQRSLTKAVARHGLGLYIYAGEDLPETTESPQKELTNDLVKEASQELVGKATKKELSHDLVKEAEELKVDLAKLCSYISKNFDDLTDEDLRRAIETKKYALEKKKEIEAKKEAEANG